MENTEVKKGDTATPPASTGKNELDSSNSSLPDGGLKNFEENEKSELEKIKLERDNYRQMGLKYKEKFLETSNQLREKELSSFQEKEQSENYNQEDIEMDDFEKKKFDSLYNKKREQEKKQDRDKNIKLALAKFFDKYPIYSPYYDFDGKNYQELQKVTSRMFLGDSVEEISESLMIAHRAINKPSNLIPKSNNEEVVDSGIGDTSSVIKGEQKKPDALTRKLNKYEQEAAKIYPGGESAYRKRLVQKENGEVS